MLPDLSIIRMFSLNQTTIEKQQRVEWMCNFEGDPPPSVAWKRNGKELLSSGRIVIYRLSVSYNALISLTIHNINRIDQGLYSCTANNTVGTVESDDYLTVYCKLKLL